MAEGKWISDLAPTTPLVDAARHVLAVRLDVVRGCLGPALHESDRDPEHVHQLRVATRRAGAAVEIFAACLPDRVYTEARRGLRRLRRAAGDARDWDVFLLTLAEQRKQSKRGHWPGLDFLTGYALGQRQTAQDRLLEASPEYPFGFDRLMAETVAAVHKPRYDPGTRVLVDLAEPLLFGLMRNLENAAAGDLHNYEHLHQVRIAGKRLRYAMEIVACCFGPSFRDDLYPAIEAMQEILGRANDSCVAVQRLKRICEQVQALMPRSWKRLKAGIEWLRDFHHDRLPREREHFQEWWQGWQASSGAVPFQALLKAQPRRDDS